MSPPSSAPKKILVVGPSWVGDMVMAQALFRTLSHASSSGNQPRIDLVAPPWSSPVATRMPEVQTVHDLAIPHGVLGLGPRRRLALKLRSERYDQAVVIPGTFKSALVPFWARIPRRTGFRGEHRYGLVNDMRALDKTVLRSTAERYCALGLSPNAPVPPNVPRPRLAIDEPNRRRLVQELGLDTDRPVVALCPGAAFGASKRWPIEHFGAVAHALGDEGWAVWVVGSKSEAPLGAAIVEAAPAAVDLCGRSTLVDAVDLLSLADVTVTNDSGLLHIGAAVGSTIIALYGSTPPWYAPPLTARQKTRHLGLECSPCFKRECPLGHHNCMRQILPDEIVADVIESAAATS